MVNQITLEGKTYKSVKEASDYYKVNYDKIRGRLRTGWTLEEAFGLIERNNNKGKSITIEGITYKSIAIACDYYNLNYGTVHNRLYNGWSIEEAFELVKKKKNSSLYKKITLEENQFDSLAEACRYYNLDSNTIYARLQIGWSIEEAFGLVKREDKIRKPITIEGKTFISIAEACKYYKFDTDLVYKRMNNYGWSIEEAFELVDRDTYRHYLNKPLVIQGKQFKSLSKACDCYNIDYSLVLYRIDRLKWSIEDAVSTPVNNHKGEKILINNIEFISLAEACRYYKVNYDKIRGRLRTGWTLEEAFELVPRKE